jgi:hypothetical protein
MAEAHDIHGAAFKNGSVTLLARIVGNDGNIVVPADIGEIRYSVFLLDDQNADNRVAVEGHEEVELMPAGVLFSSLQTGPLWTVDTTGYNFRHALDVSTYPAFPVAGRRYLVEYRLAPTAGQVIVVRFRINVT